MTRTALALTAEEWQAYRPGVKTDEEQNAFYRTVAFVTGLSPEFEIDLVAPEDCRPALCQVIEREGVDL
jgi:hypothetical protein